VDSAALYVNTGDAYDETVLFDVPMWRFYLTSLGNWVEAMGKRYGIV
jgi:hypothetical protein